MAKQTLKSLLGSSDDRKQVSLDLDQVSFQAPRVVAGQYSVSVQQTPTTSTAGQIADALGRYAGPIARQYQSIETQRQEEYEDIARLLTPEQAKAILAGDLTSVQESLDTLGKSLDAKQRKKLLKFVENPNNYIRGARVIGSKIASQYNLDLIENSAEYARSDEDISEQFKVTRDQLIKDNNLSGYALEGFLRNAAQYEERMAPSIVKAQEDRSEAQYIDNGVQDIKLKVEAGSFDEAGATFTETFNAYTPAEQASYIEDVIDNLIASDDFSAARDFVGWLTNDEDGLKVGADANLSEGVLNTLNEKISAAEIEDRRTDINYRELIGNNISEDVGVVLQQIKQGEKPESFSFTTFDGEEVSVDLTNVTNESQLLAASRDAVAVSQTLSERDKAFLYNKFDTAQEQAQRTVGTRLSTAGVPQLEKVIDDSLNLEVLGENVFGLEDDEVASERNLILDKTRADINAIYSDNVAYPTAADKEQAAAQVVQGASIDFKKDLEQRRKTYDETVRVQKVLNQLQLGPTGNFDREFTRALSEIYDETSIEESAFISSILSDTKKEITEGIREIMLADFTVAERANLAQAYTDRVQAASNFVLDKQRVSLIRAEEQQNKRLTALTEQEVAKREQSAAAERPTNLARKLFSGSFINNYDGAASDPPNGYKNNGILYHEDGQNYRGKFPAGVLYNEGVMRHEKFKKKARNLDDLRQKAVDQVSGVRSITAFGERRHEDDPLYSYISSAYFDSLYGQRTAINNEPAITLDEIKSGMLEGVVPFDTTLIKYNEMPILTPDMIMNSDDNEATIRAYASALNIKDEDINLFLYQQAQALSKRGIIFKTTATPINNNNEE